MIYRALLKRIFGAVLILQLAFQILVQTNQYVGCFIEDFRETGFSFVPGEYDISSVTPLTCLHLCSSRFPYAAITGGSVCLCGNDLNVSLKVSDSYCATPCPGSRDDNALGTCGGLLHHSVYESGQEIRGLELSVSEAIPLLSITWLNASVLSGSEVEFRFQVGDEDLSPFSNSSTVSYVFKRRGKRLVRVTARNKFFYSTSVEKTVRVVDPYEAVELVCPVVSLPGKEVVCQGEWVRGPPTLRFHFGNGVSEDVVYDSPTDQVGAPINQTQKYSDQNVTLGTFVFVSTIIPESGYISHWEFTASKQGKIRVQVFRPCTSSEEPSCQNQSHSSTQTTNQISQKSVTCHSQRSLCLSRKQCLHTDSAQHPSYNCSMLRNNSSSLNTDYHLLLEDILEIPRRGYHVVSVGVCNNFTVRSMDVIGWTSEGGQLSYVNDAPQKNIMLEYPVIGHIGSRLSRGSYTKIHVGTYALAAYVRPALKFELRHAYSHPGVYKLSSTATKVLTISVDYKITPFKLYSPSLSSTNSTILIKTGNHSGSGVTYHWNFGDNSSAISLNSSITHVYKYPGRFKISLLATNAVSQYSLSTRIEVLDPIKSCRFSRAVKVTVFGEPTFLEWQCFSGSNVTFSVNLGNGQMHIFHSNSSEFLRNKLTHIYQSAGNFSLMIAVTSPVGPNISITGQVLVEIPISGLEVYLLSFPFSRQLFIAPPTVITLKRTVLRGTHVNCVFDFGDSDAVVAHSEPRINHTYHRSGTYHVNVTCFNHVSSEWRVLNTSLVVQEFVMLSNITLSVLPTALGTQSLFRLIVNRGNFFTCSWNFGDGATLSTSFHLTSVTFNHSYSEVGSYTVVVRCRNKIGNSSATVSANVDKPIQNGTLVSKNRFAQVNKSIEFLLKWEKGSRVKYCINCEDNAYSIDQCNISDVSHDNITMVTVYHVFSKPGKYHLSARLRNSVSSSVVSDLKGIVVENSVSGVQLFITVPSRCSSLSIAACLVWTAMTEPPSNASALFDFGDGSSKIISNLDFSRKICVQKHDYPHPGYYNISVNVTNHVSSQLLIVSKDVRLNPLEGIRSVYKNGSEYRPGLGPMSQYFPAGKTVIFQLQENHDDISFLWKIGRKQLAGTKTGVLKHVFCSVGCHEIIAVIRSLTLHENCSAYICIQKELKDLEFYVTRPTYFKDPTVFIFPEITDGIDSCFTLSLGNNSTMEFKCGFPFRNLSKYIYEYKTRGNYTVILSRWNYVSAVLRDIMVEIWDEACPSPAVHIIGAASKGRLPLVGSSEMIVFKPDVTHKCHVAETVNMKWELFVLNYEEPGHKEQLRNIRREVFAKNVTDDLRKERLVILVRNLPTQVLRVQLSVSFIGKDRDLRHVHSSNYTMFEVSRSPLVALIKGGISRSVPWKTLLVLDGRSSYDPENIFDSAALCYSWSCRPMGTSLQWVHNNARFGNSSKCVKNQITVLSNSSMVTLSTEDFFPRQKYIFSLEVKEGIRRSYAEQIIVVDDTATPSMDLRCVLNCEETVNPRLRLVLRSKCSNCRPDTRLFYEWSIYTCPALTNITTTLCHIIPDFRERTSTGLHRANLAIFPNVLNMTMSYKVRCTARRSGSNRAGFVEYLFTVNSPPTGRNCLMSPWIGYALQTRFHVRCVDWYDEDLPLTYLIEVKNGRDNMYLSSAKQSNVSIFLPSGRTEKNFTIQVIVKVVDSKLFSTSTVHTVKVLQPNYLDYEQVVRDVQEAIDGEENILGFAIVISLCSMMNNRFNYSEQLVMEGRKIRLKIALILSKSKVSGFDEMRGMTNTLQTLTAKPDEINLETQDEVIKIIQNRIPVLRQLSYTSRDFLIIGTSLHRVVSNIVGAATQMSAENISVISTENTNKTTAANETTSFAELRTRDIIREAFLTLDQINIVMLNQIVAGDRPAVIQTDSYNVHLTRLSIEDLASDTRDLTNVKVVFQDAQSFLRNHALTPFSTLGLTVTELSRNPNSLYGVSANEINSKVLRMSLNSADELPVDLTEVDVHVFADTSSKELMDIVSENNTLTPGTRMKIHTFNRTVKDAALVIEFKPVDLSLKLRAFLRTGQQPTTKNSEIKTDLPDMTNGSTRYTWVLSHDMLRNFSLSGSPQFFLGVVGVEERTRMRYNYTLRVLWVKCSMLEGEDDAWKSVGCKVGPRTSSRRVHCRCRPLPRSSSVSGQHVTRNRRDVYKAHHSGSPKSNIFTKEGIFKLSVGAVVFPAPNKIHFQYVFDTSIEDNPLALVAVVTVFGVFFIALIYARRQDHKDLEKIGVSPLPDNDPTDKYLYELTVYTGCAYNAATTANVSIIISGQEGDVHPRTLRDSKRRCFQRGGVDTFLVSCPEYVGEMNYLQIWHDNTGSSPSWFLEKIVIRDLISKKSYLFLNETWLAVETEKGNVQAILFPPSYQEMTEFKRLFNKTAQRSLKDRHLWFSILARPVDSRFTRVQRLSCCLTLLYCTMLANAMFYQRTGTTRSKSSITLGPLVLGVAEISIGIMSGLIIIPVNAVIVWIFRNVEPKPVQEERVAMKQRSRIWWFYELFFCCFKSKRSGPTFMSIISQSITDHFYSRSDDSNFIDKVGKACGSNSDELVEDGEVHLQITENNVQQPNGQKSPTVLPYCYVYVAWFGLFITCITCSFFVILYGLQFGEDASAQWLSSMTISFLQDMLISEPLKVFAISAVVALIIKKPRELEHERKLVRKSLYYQAELYEKEKEFKLPSQKSYLKPPDKKELQKARAKRLKELKTGALLKELVLYMLFVICLSIVTYRNKNPSSFLLHNVLKDIFIGRPGSKGMSFQQISDVESFFAWANETLTSGAFSSSSQYGQRLLAEKGAVTAIGYSYLVGPVRLGQRRVEGAPLSFNDTGLVVDLLGQNRSQSSEIIARLKTRNWFDQKTRSLFIEINLYNAPLNLFALSRLDIQIHPTHAMIKSTRFVVTKLFALSGILGSFTVVTQAFVFLFFIVFIYRELKQLYRLKMKYFSDFWNILQGLILLVILSCIVVFSLRLASVHQLLATLETHQDHLVCFDHVAAVDLLLGCLVAFLVFLSWIRLIKFLRFNKRLLFLQETLGTAAKPLSAFSVVFLVVFAAYSHLGYMVFSRDLAVFRDIPKTFISICSLFMGHFDFLALESSNRIIGPVFLFSAMFFGVFIIINLLITLILESFLIVKADASQRENEYELLEYVAKQLRSWIGVTDTPSGAAKPCENELPVCKTFENLSMAKYGECTQQGARLRSDISRKEGFLETTMKLVNHLELELESLVWEDWAEEIVLLQLFMRGLGQPAFDWLNGKVDILKQDEDEGTDDLKEEMLQALKGYSQETVVKRELMEEGDDECATMFSPFDRSIEEVHLQRVQLHLLNEGDTCEWHHIKSCKTTAT